MRSLAMAVCCVAALMAGCGGPAAKPNSERDSYKPSADEQKKIDAMHGQKPASTAK